jgi:hypothetical protein
MLDVLKELLQMPQCTPTQPKSKKKYKTKNHESQCYPILKPDKETRNTGNQRSVSLMFIYKLNSTTLQKDQTS